MSNSRAENLFHNLTISAFMIGILGHAFAVDGYLPEETKLPFLALAAAGVVPSVCNRLGKIAPVLG